VVLHRKVKNQRLAATGYLWAFSALTASPGARAHYDRRRHAGDRHVAAQRNLFNRLLGILHHCLQARQAYNEATAFPTAETTATKEAA
jgi:hypothetical protein